MSLAEPTNPDRKKQRKQRKKPVPKLIVVHQGLTNYRVPLETITQNAIVILEFPNSADTPLARECLADMLEKGRDREMYVFETDPRKCFAGIITGQTRKHYMISYPTLSKPEYRELKDLRKVYVCKRK